MPNGWKPHALAHLLKYYINYNRHTLKRKRLLSCVLSFLNTVFYLICKCFTCTLTHGDTVVIKTPAKVLSSHGRLQSHALIITDNNKIPEKEL